MFIQRARRIFALVAALLLCSVGSPAFGADAVYSFKVNLTVAESAMPAYTQLFRELERESGGRLQFEIHYANSLVRITDILKEIKAGRLDISMLPTNNYVEEMPLNTRILQLPFMGLKDPKESVLILTQLQEEFPEMVDEFSNWNMVNLGNFAFPPYNLHLKAKKPIHVPADLKRMKIFSNKREFSQLFDLADAVQVMIPPTEVYVVMKNDIIDGYINHNGFELLFGLQDVVNTHIAFGEYGAWIDFGCTVINKDRFAALPQDLQALMTKSFAEKSVLLSDNLIAMAQKADALDRPRGDLFIELTDAQLAEWETLTKSYHTGTVAQLGVDANYDIGQYIYDRARELITERFQ